MTNSINKPNTLFWIIGVIALIWNAMGVMAFFGQLLMTEETLAALPEAEQALYQDLPIWVTIAFTVAVFGGILGSIFMLLRKKIASTIFAISLLGVLVQMTYNNFISNTFEVYGPGSVIMPIMVIVIGFFLVWYSRNSLAKGWLS